MLNELLLSETARLTLRVEGEQVEVAIPKGQGCCGIPVFVHGDVETIRELGRRNLDAMDRSGLSI